MNTAIGKLVRAELKLMTRDPLVLTFVFAFPIVTMLIIGGAFGTKPDPGFDFTNPAHWYVASYLTVVTSPTMSWAVANDQRGNPAAAKRRSTPRSR